MRFHFAWVDKSETTFDPDSHAREDEDIFAFQLTHNEGDFPALDIDVKNPTVGLLAPSRKQWAWFSYRKDDNTLVPLFFGRLIGVPQQMEGTVARLSFVARPVDFEDQKAALADTLRVAPFYDEVWLSEDDRTDPDRVLEGYPALWHIDRITGVVSVSDIVTGEDGLVEFDGDHAFYDNLSVTYSESPARRCIVQGTVKWAQTGAGSIDITNQLIEKFAEGNAVHGLANIDGSPAVSAGTLNLVAGDDMIDKWPEPGASVGGGWVVGNSYAKLVGVPPLDPILVGGLGTYDMIHAWDNWPTFSPPMVNALRAIFQRSPGFVVQVIDHNNIVSPGYPFGVALGHDKIEVLWIPVWRIAPHMEITWGVSRARTELASFEIDADVQPLLTDPGEDEIVRISVGPADVDGYIADVKRPRYFATERGQVSLQHLMMRARAALLSRARAIDLSFDADFDLVATLSCRMSGVVFDPRIPGGSGAGKVKSYSLRADGDSGEVIGSVVLGCTVGRDGEVAEVEGTPVYVDAGYVDGYQTYDGQVIVPGDTQSLGYSLDPQYAMDDDGLNMDYVVAADWLDHIEYIGTLDTHQDELTVFTGFGSPGGTRIDVIDRADSFSTTVRVAMKPLGTRAFNTTVLPVLTELKIPRTINLEAEETT